MQFFEEQQKCPYTLRFVYSVSNNLLEQEIQSSLMLDVKLLPIIAKLLEKISE